MDAPDTVYERLCRVASTVEMVADALIDADRHEPANVLRLVTKELDEIRSIVGDAEDKATNAEAAE